MATATVEPTGNETEVVEDVQVQEIADFKMVTFTLAGKDYGIDIMQVKEIAKFTRFTYVPNTPTFVRGVYNLRGDIISIIDLRLLFNLPAQQKGEDEPENGLILRLENTLLGIVVDSIDRVVSIPSSQVQPPHPIFGDINIKYISGVAERDERLYIILDIERVFGREAEEERTAIERASVAISNAATVDPVSQSAAQVEQTHDAASADDSAVQRSFLVEGLQAFVGFEVSPSNKDWFENRFASWTSERKRAGQDAQFGNAEEARQFLQTFTSRCTGRLWDSAYANEVAAALPEIADNIVHVWNPGCASGEESYSLAALISKRYPGKQVKIWASDNDLLKISNAPNLVFNKSEVPAEWHDLLVEGKNGFSFATELKNSILFEFSDLLTGTGLPKMDIVVTRDVLSYMKPSQQTNLFEQIDDRLKTGGVLMLGDNEVPPTEAALTRLQTKTAAMFQLR